MQVVVDRGRSIMHRGRNRVGLRRWTVACLTVLLAHGTATRAQELEDEASTFGIQNCTPGISCGIYNYPGNSDFAGTSTAATDLDTVFGAPGAKELRAGGAVIVRGSRAPATGARIFYSASQSGDAVGRSVALSSDGTMLAVGAPGRGAGVVLIYVRSGASWVDRTSAPGQIVSPPGIGAGNSVDSFGHALAFDAAGNLVVGAPTSTVGGRSEQGAAMVYRRSGSTVSFVATILPPPGGAIGDKFGSSVAAAGGIVAIGSPLRDSAAGPDTGAVFVYRFAGNALAPGLEQLDAAAVISGNKFGASVAIGVNGQRRIVAVGAPGMDTAAGEDSGGGVLYESGAGEPFTPRATLVPAAGPGQAAGESIATNGDMVVLGSPLADSPNALRAGAFHLFDVPESSLVRSTRPRARIQRLDASSDDGYGAAAAMSARRIVVGAPTDDFLDPDQGSVQTFSVDRLFRGDFES
jgi:hypothetical protein